MIPGLICAYSTPQLPPHQSSSPPIRANQRDCYSSSDLLLAGSLLVGGMGVQEKPEPTSWLNYRCCLWKEAACGWLKSEAMEESWA